MSTNWFRRLSQQVAVSSTRRRVHRSLGPIEQSEVRTLLAALAYSPKQSGAAAAGDVQGAPLFPLSETFKLHSNPSATKVIYLDFNGQQVTGTAWNENGNTLNFEAYSFEGDASFSNNELEQLQRIWARVAEDFAPFNVNVTTEEPPIEDLRNTGGGDTRWGIRALISNNDPLNTGAGGVAYIGSFNWDSDTPALVFNGGEKAAAETVSHEVGHSLFLGHDGRTSPVEEYYFGHGTGATSWGPIQGASFSPSLSQWSKGEYANASNPEDDLFLITTRNGFTYRADDAGNNIGTAKNITKLPAVGNSISVDQKGIIEQRTDFDYYRLNVGNGPVTLNINGAVVGTNLDILAEVYDSNGVLVASSNPLDQVNASVTFQANLGAYYLKIDGVGAGDVGGTGYSDYGSLGQYHITGSYVNPENSPPILNDQTLPNLKEGSPLNTVVGTVLAQEPDEAQRLTYSILSGNPGGAFAINPSTGVITIANPNAVDFEVSQEFRLTVQVTDNGTPSRADTGIVTIRILDAVTYTFDGGILTVEGTTLNDEITVFSEGGTARINDGLTKRNTEIALSQITEIRILGLQGNDTLKMDATLGTKTGKLYGAQGEDTLISGLGADLLDGGDATDTVLYSQATSGVNINLSLTTAQNTGGAGSDSFASIENVTGSRFNDTLTGNGSANTLRGLQGNDTLRGMGGDDILDGSEGLDSLSGDEGGDTLRFDNFDTLVAGGTGIDTAVLVSSTGSMTLTLLPGQLEAVDASASQFNNTIDATGATWSVTIKGGSGNDRIVGGSASDFLYGGLGNDVLIGKAGSDRLDGGHGEDRLEIDSQDTAFGGAGKDTLVVLAESGPVNVNLGEGQIEVVNAELSTQNNVFNASTATWNVTVTGGRGNDTITGGSANDLLNGGLGNDTIVGGAGTDTLDGGAGIDSLSGDAGNDLLYFDNFDTTVNGGAGSDTATVKGATTGVTVNLRTSLIETVNAETSRFENRFDATGATWIVTVTGGSGGDTIIGGNLNDRLLGGGGNDFIVGNAGNDFLDGGAGIDTLDYSLAAAGVVVNLATGRASGGAGTDTLVGFENLNGSIFRDTLTGTSAKNIIRGNGGLDIINGGGGLDSIIR